MKKLLATLLLSTPAFAGDTLLYDGHLNFDTYRSPWTREVVTRPQECQVTRVRLVWKVQALRYFEWIGCHEESWMLIKHIQDNFELRVNRKTVGTSSYSFPDILFQGNQYITTGIMRSDTDVIVIDITDQHLLDAFQNGALIELAAKQPDVCITQNGTVHFGSGSAASMRFCWFIFGNECIPQECGPCDGKVSYMDLQYDGPSGDITAYNNHGDLLFSGFVPFGGTFTVAGGWHDGTLGPKVKLFLDDEFVQEIHTSCSQPIAAGMTFGDFTLLAGASKNGGPLCFVVD